VGRQAIKYTGRRRDQRARRAELFSSHETGNGLATKHDRLQSVPEFPGNVSSVHREERIKENHRAERRHEFRGESVVDESVRRPLRRISAFMYT